MEAGKVCYSALVEEDGRFVRRDYSTKGWRGPPPGAIGYWRRLVPPADVPRSAPLDADALMQYLEQLAEDDAPAQEKLKYVLALLLIQKKRLAIDEEQQEGEVRTLHVSGSRGEGPFAIREFDLSEEEGQELQRAVTAFLWGADV